MSTLAQVRAEAKTLYDESWQIIVKNGGKIDDNLSNEDIARLGENKAKLAEKEPIIARLQEQDADTAFFQKGRDAYGRPVEPHVQPGDTRRSPFARSIGAGVIASDPYRAAKQSGELALSQPRLVVPLPSDISLFAETKRARLGQEHKALLTSADGSAGAFVITDRLEGVSSLARQTLTLLDALPTRTTTSDLVEWVQQDTFTNNAAPVAEATATSGTSGLKPESALAYSIVSKPVEQIAHWIPATNRILADASGLRAEIDDNLLYGLNVVLEQQVVSGNGTPPQLLGINSWPGTQTMAAGANPADSIFAASMACVVTGGLPATAAILAPAAVQALRLMRENVATGAQGGYVLGPPNMPGPLTVFGLDIIMSTALPAGTAYVLNMTPATIVLVEREGGTIETGWANDQFWRNQITIRAELRGLLVIRRPKCIVKLSGMPTAA